MGSLLPVIRKQIGTKHLRMLFRLVITGLLVLQANSGIAAPPQKKPSDKHKITLDAKLSHDRSKPDSVLHALLTVNVQDGWHINSANPSDDNLIPTSVEIQKKKIIDSLSIHYPSAEDRKFDFSEETMEVYEGTIRILIRMEIRKSARPGTYLIPVTVHYQSCSNSICLAPTSVSINMPIRITNNAGTIHEINKDLFSPYILK